MLTLKISGDFSDSGVISGNNLSGVAVQFATQFGANATHYYVGVAVFHMENDILAHASMLNCYTIFLKQIIP